MIQIGLLGAGHLGKIHLKLLKEIEAFEVAGFYDTDPEVRKNVSESLDIPAFEQLSDLLDRVQAVDIVTPTLSHHALAVQAIEAGKHVFIEKPLTESLEEAQDLIRRVGEKGLIGQVGHVERFNPAFLSVGSYQIAPMFIEGHRLAQYNPRGTDVSVVLDLMIHDLDVVLSLVPSPVKHISASGVPVISDSPDIANARIEFENGCVANLTASRISMKNMRRLRMFQRNTYLAVDFLKKQSEIVEISDEMVSGGLMQFELDADGKQKKYLTYDMPKVPEVNSIKMELEEFAAAIAHGAKVRVSFQDGFRALKVAHEILEKIQVLTDQVLAADNSAN